MGARSGGSDVKQTVLLERVLLWYCFGCCNEEKTRREATEDVFRSSLKLKKYLHCGGRHKAFTVEVVCVYQRERGFYFVPPWSSGKLRNYYGRLSEFKPLPQRLFLCEKGSKKNRKRTEKGHLDSTCSSACMHGSTRVHGVIKWWTFLAAKKELMHRSVGGWRSACN